MTFGKVTVVEDPYDIVQRMVKSRAKSGVSLIHDSGECGKTYSLCCFVT